MLQFTIVESCVDVFRDVEKRFLIPEVVHFPTIDFKPMIDTFQTRNAGTPTVAAPATTCGIHWFYKYDFFDAGMEKRHATHDARFMCCK